MSGTALRYKRVLLKLSGEALAGDGDGIDGGVLRRIAEEIVEVTALGLQVGVVIGAGNIFRGVSAAAEGMNRPMADSMGMLGTVINSLALQDALRRAGQSVAESASRAPSSRGGIPAARTSSAVLSLGSAAAIR